MKHTEAAKHDMVETRMERLKRVRWPWAWFVYAGLVAGVALILFWRFPNAVLQPNFYGEDGSVYLQNVLDKGWVAAAVTTFNGYFIVGLYAICAFGSLINAVFLGGSLLTLPLAYSWAAIGFMAAVAALPYLLFRRQLGTWLTLLAVALSALLPLPISPHAVIGTIGNQKWIFFYLAFLLAAYRVINFQRLRAWQFIAIDAVILVSAYTNSAVYFVLPVLAASYLREWRQALRRPGAWLVGVLRKPGAPSLLVSGGLAAVQLGYVAGHGIPKLAGYLDEPFMVNRAIELFINRTYLFGATHLVNGRLNDALVVLLFIVLVLVALRFVRDRRQRFVFWFGVYCAGMASVLFAVTRPGVSHHFAHYASNGSGPDQFYYTQTLIMYLPLLIVGAALTARLAPRWRLGWRAAGVLGLIGSGLVSNAVWGSSLRHANIYYHNAGTFTDQAVAVCASDPSPRVTVPVYPYGDNRFALTADRRQVCTGQLQAYQSSRQDLHLDPYNNSHLPLKAGASFTQTFHSERPGLSGVTVYLSTFGILRRQGEYRFELRDKTCRSVLRQARIPTVLLDNSEYDVEFASLGPASGGADYCFTLVAPTGSFSPLAIQRSAPGIYPDGEYRESGAGTAAAPAGADAVFSLIYTQRKP